MTRRRRTPPLSDLRSRCCHARLTREYLGLRCSECNNFALPMTVTQLAEQAAAKVATHPVTPTTGAALKAGLATLYEENYD